MAAHADSTATLIDAKGDLLVGTGADALARLAKGAQGYFLLSDTAQTTGLGWGRPLSIIDVDREYGPPSDGTDALVEWQDAVDDAESGSDGIVFAGAGKTYDLDGTLYIPSKVAVFGHGYNSILRARTGATLDTDANGKGKFIQLGPANDALAFGTSLNDIKIDANGIAASVAVYTSNAQENCGVINAVVSGWKDCGIKAQGIGGLPQNFVLRDLHVLAGPDAGSTVTGSGINLSAVPWCLIERVTVASNSGVMQTNRAAITMAAGGARLQSLHVENFTHGVQNDASMVSLDDLSGGNITNLINLVQYSGASTSIIATQLKRGVSVTRVVYNEINGVTITDALQYAYGGQMVMSLPTANPAVVGALWNNSGVVNVSAG